MTVSGISKSGYNQQKATCGRQGQDATRETCKNLGRPYNSYSSQIRKIKMLGLQSRLQKNYKADCRKNGTIGHYARHCHNEKKVAQNI